MFDELEDLDFSAFSKKLSEDIQKKKELGKTIDDIIHEEYGEEASAEEVRKDLTVTSKVNELAVIRGDGLAIRKDGSLTISEFFSDLNISEDYAGLAFTEEEAKKITRAMRKKATGPNSVLAVTCTGPQCSFAAQCVYQQLNKAPIGLPCIVEGQLLEYHTKKLMEQFNVQVEDYAELMLVQEIAETYVTEMRANMVLAKAENAEMMGLKLKFSPDGETVQEETSHWALGVKEKIKDRRMKVLKAFMATREANQKALAAVANKAGSSYFDVLKKLNDKLESLKIQTMEEVKVYEVRDNS